MRKNKNLSSEGIKKYADRISVSTDIMLNLIQELQEIGKTKNTGLSISKEDVDLIFLLNSTVDVLKVQAESKNQELTIDISPHLPHIYCDSYRIRQVLTNLLGNAIKFTPEGGKISVSAKCDGNYILVSVEDSGPGIDQKYLTKVFDYYWQVQNTAHPGSGLGLYIAKGIIKAHQGKIWAEGRLGSGAKFNFTLPIEEFEE